MTDLDDRDERQVVAALRDFVDRIPLSENGSAHPAASTAGRRHPLALPALVAAVVVAILVTVNLAAGGDPGRSADPADGISRAVLPDRIAGYSYINSRAESMPPGPAILSFQHGSGSEFFLDIAQQVVVGADGVSYREVTTAYRDVGIAPTLLSPDGSLLAVGAPGDVGSVALLNLRTGAARTITIGNVPPIVPRAWSADGRRLYLTHGGPPDTSDPPRPTVDLPGVLVRVDVVDGTRHTYQPEIVTESVATSPDGSSLALSMLGESGLKIVSADTGALLRTVTGSPGYNLGENAWSPDGRRLALVTVGSLIVVSLADGRSVTHVVGGGIEGLGWTSNSGYLVFRGDNNFELVTVDATTGDVRRLSRFASSPGSYPVSEVTVARDLTLSWQVRPAGRPQRGPGPIEFQVLLVVAALIGGWSLKRAIQRRMRRAAAAPDHHRP